MFKKISMLLMALTYAGLQANDFRVPVVGRVHGYDFDPKLNDGWQVSIDSSVYSRQAERAFGKHGTSTNNLTALFFNKDSFRLSNAFEKCQVPYATQYYNPYMRVITIAPRARYTENGMQVTAQIDRDVLGGKGRWGVRVRVPFKSVEIERRDTSSRRDSQTEDVMRKQKSARVASNGVGFAYRLDFLEAMPNEDMTDEQVVYSKGSPAFAEFFGGPADGNAVAAVYVPEGHGPQSNIVGVREGTLSTTILPVTLDNLSANTLYKIEGGYAGLSDADDVTTATRVANQDKKATVWLTSTYDSDGNFVGDGAFGGSSGASQAIGNNMDQYIATFNTNVYEWLHDRGYVMESSSQVGLGDIDVDLFYRHELTDRVIGEASLLIKLPTAYGSQYNDNLYSGNPYRAHLGNGGHFEVGVRAGADWEAYAWLNVHLDSSYQFALDSTEHRCAVPKESFIKNMGPSQEAGVSWSSYVGNVEFHMCHPHTTDITGMVGYQLYYKGQETVKFKNATTESWLGKTYETSDGGVTVTTAANDMTLDGKLAAANSEQWAHRLRMGLSYHFSDWFAVSSQTAFTFAGSNVPKALECQVSARVAW